MRLRNWLPIAVIALVVAAIGTAAWWVAAAAAPKPDRQAAAIGADQFAALLGRDRTTDEGCINCHTDRKALTADLEKNPVEEAQKSTETEGQG